MSDIREITQALREAAAVMEGGAGQYLSRDYAPAARTYRELTSPANLTLLLQHVEKLEGALNNVHRKLCEAQTLPGYEAVSAYSWCVDECRLALSGDAL